MNCCRDIKATFSLALSLFGMQNVAKSMHKTGFIHEIGFIHKVDLELGPEWLL